uniref:Ig-like domain-containing protein n=1 Tax=Maylandia zebra TaxID=106582 RepID=A0A3P9AV04_9CICH
RLKFSVIFGIHRILLIVIFDLSMIHIVSSLSGINTTAGQDVTLTCRAPNNNNIIVVEWSRADLESEYVILYRDGHFVPDHQHPSFKNRVDLQDRQMKDGDVSLILENVTIDDNGTYECRIFTRGANCRKGAHLKTDPISIISLRLSKSEQLYFVLCNLSALCYFLFQTRKSLQLSLDRKSL